MLLNVVHSQRLWLGIWIQLWVLINLSLLLMVSYSLSVFGILSFSYFCCFLVNQRHPWSQLRGTSTWADIKMILLPENEDWRVSAYF